MALERTFSIVKPDAVARNLVGEIYSRFEKAGLKIIASRMLLITEEQAAGFYAEHDGKPFYEDLCSYMRSGPVMIQVLEGEDAILANRKLMGATDPKEAEPGTILLEMQAGYMIKDRLLRPAMVSVAKKPE